MLIQGQILSFSCVQTSGSDCVFSVTIKYNNEKLIFNLGDLNYIRIVECVKDDKITLRVQSKDFNLPPKLNNAILCNNDAYIEPEPEKSEKQDLSSIVNKLVESLEEIKRKVFSRSPPKKRKYSSSTSSEDVTFLNSSDDEKDVNLPGIYLFLKILS